MKRLHNPVPLLDTTSVDKVNKDIKRALEHQMIMFENPPIQDKTKDETYQMEGRGTVSIIKPSSLNYKVSLKEAVTSFVQKHES